MIEFIQTQLENQFLSGGMVLMIFGTVLATGRRIPIHIYNYLKRKLVTSVDVSDQDPAFYWLQEWLAQHEYSQKTRLLTASTNKGEYGMMEKAQGPPESGSESRPQIAFSPAPGMHLLRFEGQWLLLTRDRKEVQTSQSSKFWRDSFVIQTFARDREVLRRLLYEAQEVAFPDKERRVELYTPAYNNWQVVASRPPRDPESVVLEGALMEDLLEDTKTFFASAEWYHDRGIPYQRGYLLYGPPGNGKTSIAIVLASALERDVYLAKVSSIDDGVFRQLMAQVPRHAIVLIEDVDCFFEGRESTANDSYTRLSFSGFLNAVDGITCSDGRLLILTTNHPEKLDEALVRAGRIDRKVEIGNATCDQAHRLFLRFFDSRDQATRFSGALPDGGLSMADLQGILLDNRADPEGAIVALRELPTQLSHCRSP